MNLQSRLKAVQPVIIVLLLAVFLRTWAVALLPEDFDEPTYLQVGFDYAHDIQTGNFNAVIDYPGVSEHPAFVKLLYTGAVLVLGKAATWTNAFYASRAISAFFGVMAVAFIAIILDPLAAGMLAVQTLAVKYTSQVYLEAVPSAMTILAVLAFLRVKKDQANRWLWISAVALGVATASKYTYIPVIVIVLGYLAIFEKKVKWYWLLAYSAVAVGIFLVLDISLWHDPLNRLYQSLFFHIQYSQGAHVQEVAYPWYQPFIWIFASSPASWHPTVFFYYGFDGIISILAVLGIKREFKERRWLVVWLSFGVLFLLFWPTKWPQYTLTVVPALCIMGAGTLQWIWKWVREQESYWEYFRNLLPTPGKWLWIGLGAFVLFLASIYLSAAIRLAVGRVGWSNLSTQNSFLPGNAVHAILPLDNGQMLIATDKGVAFWSPPQTTDQTGQWIIYNHRNSGLSSDQVLSAALDTGGNFWFGTSTGVSEYQAADQWISFHATDLHLPDERIISIAAGNEGRVYAGSLSGAAMWDGSAWTPLVPAEGKTVFALTAVGDSVWIGTADGAGRLDIPTETWSFYPTIDAVKGILVDSSGTVWAATSGSGLAKLEGNSWQYFTTSSGDLPSNNINQVVEIKPGTLWIATSMSTDAGGTPVSFDGRNWRDFTTDNSGASGAEPVVIVRSTTDQVWIGTATHGIDIYKLGR
jgi:4-amino-4-deoxy-L-arabinose transferase-like glycosyltransferase